MTITAAIVLFAIIWWTVFFCVLPVRFKSQSEAGSVVPGTPQSAPDQTMLKPKAWITTGITVVLFVILYLIITSGKIGIADLDIFNLRASHP